MRKNYIHQLWKRTVGEGGGFWIFDPKHRMHRTWDFSKIDMEKMKEAGILWVTEVCNHALHNTENPWFHFGWIIRKHLQNNQREYIFPSLDEMNLKEKENIWDAYVWFMKSMYVTPRYVQRQEILWQDMREDHDFFKEYFRKYSRIHVELLIHHMASVIGFELGNVAGD